MWCCFQPTKLLIASFLRGATHRVGLGKLEFLDSLAGTHIH
jgi:hypothetical protein